MPDWLIAILLGLVEGLTEFLPVSSTGHQILVADLFGLDLREGSSWGALIVINQLGAICAVLVAYWPRFWGTLTGLTQDPVAQRFARNLILGVLPALVIGVVAYSTIKDVLFTSPVVAAALVLGGIAILVIERVRPAATVPDVDAITWRTALLLGLIQCLAMVPGVSRSGALILGGLMLGLERRAAAEFSFFLAAPTMAAAASYDVYKTWFDRDGAAADTGADLPTADWALVALSFAVAFVVALVVVRWMIGFVSRHGFAPFAWYRIALGLLMGGLILAGVVSVTPDM